MLILICWNLWKGLWRKFKLLTHLTLNTLSCLNMHMPQFATGPNGRLKWLWSWMIFPKEISVTFIARLNTSGREDIKLRTFLRPCLSHSDKTTTSILFWVQSHNYLKINRKCFGRFWNRISTRSKMRSSPSHLWLKVWKFSSIHIPKSVNTLSSSLRTWTFLRT